MLTIKGKRILAISPHIDDVELRVYAPRSLATGLDCLLSPTPAERRKQGKQGQAATLRHLEIRTKLPQLHERVLEAERV